MSRRGAGLLAAWFVASIGVLGLPVARPDQAATAQASTFTDPHFRESTVFTGLTNPIAIRFAADGRAFIAQKNGRVFAYDSITDTTPTAVLDLRTETDDYWDRGLLGMVLDPNFLTSGGGARPYLYVFYVYDAPPGQVAPVWNDACPGSPTGPGPNLDGCVVTAKLARYTVDRSTNVADPASRVELLHDWCAQFPSHSGGAMTFGSDGMLYLAGGDGASFTVRDYGQRGGTVPNATSPYTPINPCSDPLTVTSAAGQTPTVDIATSEAGALRSQDVRTTGDPTGLAGSLIRINPDTGLAAAGNPLISSADLNNRRIVAHGFRNPFRLTVRPGTDELYIGDVGSGIWEEINRVVLPSGPATPTSLPNYGWPCYEGGAPADGWPQLGIDMCQSLYDASPTAVTSSLYAYNHTGTAAPCGVAGLRTASISGLAFYEADNADQTPFPAAYDGALFFADYSRKCLAVLFPDANGVPDPASMQVVATNVFNPVDLVVGPHGDLYYPNLDGGFVTRIRYAAEPVAHATVTPLVSSAPVTVTLDASDSIDPDAEGQLVAWRWDLDHDGVFNEPVDRNGEVVQWSVTNPGVYPVTLRVESSTGLTDSIELVVDASNVPPVPVINAPDADLHWSVGETITFSGSATDAEDGPLAASKLDWEVGILHCGPNDCHEHTVQTFDGVPGGSFAAPDHDYPSKLVIRLSATDSHGTVRMTSRELDPATATLDVTSVPVGVPITVGDESGPTPQSNTVIRGGALEVSAPAEYSDGSTLYRFAAWSDGSAARNRDLNMTGSRSLTALYVSDAADTCDAAQPLARDTWVSQHTTGPGDEDWYAFTLSKQRETVISLGDLPVDAALELYGACDALLATSDANGTNSEELVRSLPGGTYRLRVHVPSGEHAAAPWVVRLGTSGKNVIVKSARATRSSGTVRISGEVLNLTGATTGRAAIVAQLRDAGGRIVGTLSGETFAPSVLDRGVTSFRITGKGPAFSTVTFKVTPGSPVTDRRLVLRGFSSTSHPDGTATLTGRVRNDDTRRAPDVAVARTWYGRRGEVLEVRIASTNPSRLAPGEKGRFTMTKPALVGIQAARTTLRGR